MDDADPPGQSASLERAPLIQPAPRNSGGSGGSIEARRPVIAVAPANGDEQPVPPQLMTAVGGIPAINCRMCRAQIVLDGKMTNHVVKCPTCNEATPIRSAPEGKRYVRCPCGCLLVCKQAASRISCPRDQCRRVLNLTTSSNAPASELDATTRSATGYGATTQPGNQLIVSHLQCPSCNLSFLLQSDSSTAYARCPHCSARAVLNKSYVRCRSITLALLALLFLAGGTVALVFTLDYTFKERHYAVIAGWGSLFAVGLACAIGAIYFCAMRVAKVMTSATSAYGPSGRYSYA